MTNDELALEHWLLKDWLELEYKTASSATELARKVSIRLAHVNEEIDIRDAEADTSMGGMSDNEL